jgi:hypothetical protein
LQPTGQPASGVPVEGASGVPTAQFGLYAAAVSDAAGRFRLGPFTPGRVSVRPGWGGLLAERDDSARTIEVVAGQPAELTIAVPRPVAVNN